jgi:hypothetical protein
MAPQAGFEPATLRLTGGKKALAALCGGVPNVAGTRFIPRRIRRFPPSPSAGLCDHLPLIVASKGQEKGNVSAETSRKRRRSSSSERQVREVNYYRRQIPLSLQQLRKGHCPLAI